MTLPEVLAIVIAAVVILLAVILNQKKPAPSIAAPPPLAVAFRAPEHPLPAFRLLYAGADRIEARTVFASGAPIRDFANDPAAPFRVIEAEGYLEFWHNGVRRSKRPVGATEPQPLEASALALQAAAPIAAPHFVVKTGNAIRYTGPDGVKAKVTFFAVKGAAEILCDGVRVRSRDG